MLAILNERTLLGKERIKQNEILNRVLEREATLSLNELNVVMQFLFPSKIRKA